jgi:hypothetical protein
MSALSLQAIAPITSGFNVPSVPVRQPPSLGETASTLSVQDLAQGVFQRALQSAAISPLGEPSTGSASLARESTASLLASLNAPQPQVQATSAPEPSTPVTAPEASTSSAPSPIPPAMIDSPAPPDLSAASSTPDFALQTALRFGAGVMAQVGPGVLGPDLGQGLVRDATEVLRLGSIQPHAGGPGPEAFTQPRATSHGVSFRYPEPQVVEPSSGLDLMA